MEDRKNYSSLTAFRNKYIRRAAYAAFVLLALSWLVSFYSLDTADYLLIIHFTPVKGIDFLGNKSDVFAIIFSAFAIFAVNLFLVAVLYRRFRLLSFLLSFFNVFLSTLILILVGVIIGVN